jgi:hypothetical protein
MRTLSAMQAARHPAAGANVRPGDERGSVTATREPGREGSPEPGTDAPATAVAVGCLAALILAIAGLVLFGGWVGFAIALALMLLGVVALTRFLQLMLKRRPDVGGGAPGQLNEDLPVGEEVHSDLSSHDVPLENPAHRELKHSEEQSHRSPGGTMSRNR